MRNPSMGHIFLTTNRAKRSVVLNLKTPGGRDTLLHLARTADVLVYNLRPQAMQRLGLRYEDLREVNPRIIYVGAFGFSQRGPYAGKPAYDDLIQGMCGIPWLTQQAGAEVPRYAPLIIAGRIVGLQLAGAISTALVHRERTGEGQRVDVPMFEGLLSVVLGEHLVGMLFEPPLGPAGYKRSLSPDRRPYRTQDGHICTLIYNDKHWRSFFSAIGDPDRFEADPRFSSQGARLQHIDDVYGYLATILEKRRTQEWMELFERHDIPAAPMYSVPDILQDDHIVKTDFVRKVQHSSEGPLLSTAIPTEWFGSPLDEPREAPRLGEHSYEVLLEAGFPRVKIDALIAEGAVVVHRIPCGERPSRGGRLPVTGEGPGPAGHDATAPSEPACPAPQPASVVPSDER